MTDQIENPEDQNEESAELKAAETSKKTAQLQPGQQLRLQCCRCAMSWSFRKWSFRSL